MTAKVSDGLTKAQRYYAAHRDEILKRKSEKDAERAAARTPGEPCACGCGDLTTGAGGEFISGHNSRVAHPMTGQHHSAETKAKLASYTGEQASSYVHGWSKTPTYVSWRSMIGRCYHPGNASYPAYGGRGITVCDRWLTFENFLEDMGERPSLDHSIDRREVNGNYDAGNCRWLTRAEQNARRKDPGGWITRRARQQSA